MSKQIKVEYFDNNDSEIPAPGMNFQGAPKALRKKATTQRSNFMFSYNPNISFSKIKDANTRKDVTKHLVLAMKNFEGRMRDQSILKKFGNNPLPNLTECKFGVEIGQKRASYMSMDV